MNTPDTALQLADMALVPPLLNTSPLPRYGYDRLDYGMTIGIERTSGGRLWVCWVGGGDNDKAFFLLASSDDGGESWSDPRLVIDPHDTALPLARRTIVGNLWLDPLGRLWLFFDQAMSYFDGRAGNWFTRCDNPDADTPHWTQPRRIWHGCSLNKPIVLRSGEWLLPLSLWNRGKIPAGSVFAESFHELDALRGANVLASADNGETWQFRGGVTFPCPDFDEHNLVELPDGRLWMSARTGGHNGIWESFSSDNGATWQPPVYSGLAHVSSRHFMRRLPSGRLLLIKHGMPAHARPQSRSHLAAYLSDDDGATWQGGLLLDERTDVSYPDGTVTADGRIFISYDRERDKEGEILLARFTEADVLAGRCISPGSVLRKVITRADRQAMQERHERRISDLLQEKLGSDACHAIDVPEWLVQTEPEPTTQIVTATATETALETATGKPANDNAGNIATTAYPESEAIARLSEPLPDTFTRSGADAAPWHRLRPRPDSHFVQLDALSTARVGKLARAHCFAYSPQEQDASFVLGADYWLKFSINGVALIDHSRQPRGIGIGIITPAEFKTQAHLRAGWNRLEMTLISGSDGFGFACFCAAAHALRFALSDGDSAPATADAPADVPTDANA